MPVREIAVLLTAYHCQSRRCCQWTGTTLSQKLYPRSISQTSTHSGEIRRTGAHAFSICSAHVVEQCRCRFCSEASLIFGHNVTNALCCQIPSSGMVRYRAELQCANGELLNLQELDASEACAARGGSISGQT